MNWPPPPKGTWLQEQPRKLVLGAKFTDKVVFPIVFGGFALFFSVASYPSSLEEIEFSKLILMILILSFPWLLWAVFIFGTIKISFTANHLEVFAGLGFIGKRHKIPLKDITSIQQLERFNGPDDTLLLIRIRGQAPKQRIDVGWSWSPPLMQYVLTVLQTIFDKYQSNPEKFLNNGFVPYLIDPK